MARSRVRSRSFTLALLGLSLICGLALGGCEGCDDEDGDGAADAADVQDAADVPDDMVDDAEDVPEDVTDADDTEDTGPEVSTLVIRVFDIDGKIIEGANVEAPGTTQQTDSSGEVIFEEVPSELAYVRVTADGYAPTAARMNLPPGVSAVKTLHMLPEGDSQEFDASSDSTVYEDRVRVDIPANALETEDGTPFSGTGIATITPLNPSTEENAAYPRPLEGILEGDSEPTPFQSILMADIRLETQAGDPLSVTDGSSLTLEYVIPDDLQGEFSTGDEIEAYWYDARPPSPWSEISAGIWRQEGMGTVIESTYAAEKLAWQVDVSHLTWWNCDEPWTNKNCVQVEVTEEGTNDPVSGADVYVEGTSYNGTSYGTTNANGVACVDFKLDSNAELSVVGPNGRTQSGGAAAISGSPTAAACSGEGGECQEITVELTPPTCVTGSVVDGDANALQDANVSAVYPGANGQQSATATTDASGEYCVEIPQNVDAEIIVTKQSGGDFLNGSAEVSTATTAASCGSQDCTSAPEITAEAGQSSCLTGTVRVNDSAEGIDRTASAGTHVYAFRGSVEGGAAGGDINIDCSTDPSDWGTLLSETTTDADGEFCAPVPVSTEQVTIIAGKCGSQARECLGFGGIPEVTTAATCGGGSCTALPEVLTMFSVCGDGP